MKGFVDLRTLLLLGLHILIATSQGDKDTPGCSWDGRMYSNREVWRPDPCKMCTCYKGVVSCDDLVCDDVTDCKRTMIPEGQCCPQCLADLDCAHYGRMFVNRDVWKPEPCQICVCYNGDVSCDQILCDEVTDCKKTVTPEGQCCPECQPDIDGGKVNEGQKKQYEDCPIHCNN